ncbi:Ig-like domain-containing protein [Enterovibrio norvegicus]|uniref:Ig-like domain-containing protein n=1 Tax=Enterovibrio norvegicus TaxID=188144 RepID=UPI0024B04AF0|nr:Ig-like domain-containing protein [Enterovibrio norvegicus]
MGQLKVPSNAEILFISGLASLVKAGEKQPLKVGALLNSGDTINVDEGTLIEFQGNDGSLSAVVSGGISSLAALLNNQDLTDEAKDKIQGIVDTIELGQDPTLNEDNATAAGSTLLSSGSNGFFVLSRSANETIANAGYDTVSYIDPLSSLDAREEDSTSLFSTPVINLNVDDLTNDNTPTIFGQTNILPGSIVQLTITDSLGNVQTLTATVNEDGSFSIEIPNPLPDGSFSITATFTDSQGNSVSATADGMVDTLAPGQGAGPNGTDESPLVDIPEASGGVGEDELSDGITVLVTPPTGTEPGDTIVVTVINPDGSTSETTTSVPQEWTEGGSVTVIVSPEDLGGSNGNLPDEGDYTITTTVTDGAGNTSSPSEPIEITIDTTAPGEGVGPGGTDELPIVSIPDAAGGVGEEELNDGIEVLVTPPTGTQPGDIITVTVTQPDGSTTDITTTVPDGWTGGTTVPVVVSPENLGGSGGELPDEGNYTVTTTVTYSAGNTSSPSVPIEITIDTTAPGEGTGPNGTDELPLVEVPEATGGVGEDELTDGVDVLVTPPTGTLPGDTITVTVTQPDGSTTDVTTTVPDGWTSGTPVPVVVSPEDLGGNNGELPDEGDYTITTTVTDGAGNTSSPSKPIAITIDTTAPGEGTGPNGTDELPLVEVPEATGGVGEDELTDGVDVLVTPPTGTLPGDTITVTVTQPDGSTTDVTTTVPDGWTGGTPVPVVVSPEDLGGTGGELPDEGDYTITTTVTDGAGNTSSPSEETGFTVDTTAPGEGTGEGGADEIPLVAIPEAADGVNKDEASDGVDVLVTPPTGIKPGDTVTLTLTKPDGSTTDISTTVPAGWTDGTAVTVTIPTSDIGDGSSFTDGDYTLTATASDTAGNSSQPSDSIGFTLDTTAPGEGTGPNGTDELPLVEVPEATGGVGEDELTDGVDVLVTPPTGIKPGDTVTLTLTKPDGSTTDISTTVPAGWTDGTAVTVTIPTSDIGDGSSFTDGDYTLTATASDTAGNSSQPSDSIGFTLDTTAPGEGTGPNGTDELPLVEVPEATGGVGEDELTDGVDVLVTPPTGTLPGDTITVTVTQPDGSTTDVTTTVPDGWTGGTPVPVVVSPEDLGGTGGELPDEGDYTITTTVTDGAGNTSSPSEETGFTVDTTAPGEGTGEGGADEIPLVAIPEAADGVNKDEASDGVDVLVTPPTGIKPGDTVTLTLTKPDGSTTDISTTVPAGWTDGTAVTVTIPTSDIGDGSSFTDGDYTLTATASDTAGNSSQPSDSIGFTLDTTAPGEGTGPNGTDELPLVEVPEATGGVGEDELTDGVDVLVTPPTGTLPGDTITVTVTQPDGSTTDVTTTVPDGWTGGTPVPVVVSPEDLGGTGGELPDEGDYTITTTVTDGAGNTSSPSEETGFTVDTTAPGEGTGEGGADEIPLVAIPEAADGVNKDEASDGVDVLVTPPTGIKPGDTVTLTLTKPDGSTTDISTTVPAGWTDGTAVTVTIPTSDIGDGSSFTDGDYTLTATASDTAGNSSQPSKPIAITIDTTAPGEGTGPNGTDELPLVEVPEATGGVGEDELTDGVDVLVTPPTGTLPGDTITVTVTQPDGSTTDVTTTVPDGWTGGTPVPVVVSPEDLGGTGGELPDEGDYTITTTVTDGAGNTSSPSEETGFTVDTTAPGEGTGEGGADEIPLVAIPEAADGVNKDEASDGVDVLVTPPTGIKPGDTVTLTLTKPDGSTTDISTTVPAGWTDGTAVTVTIPTSDIGDGSSFTDGDYTLTATASDTAGNSSQPSDSIGFTLDTTAPGEGTGPNGTDELPLVEVPEATGGVGEDELTDGVDVLVTPPTGTLPGDTITVTVTQPDGSTTDVTTTVPDGWTGGTPVPVVVSPEDLGGTGGELPDEGDYTITTTVTDGAGNTSSPSEETGFTVDTTAPGEGTGEGGADEIPLVAIPEAADGVNKDEASDGVDVLVTPPTGIKPGDTVTLTLTKPDGSTTDISTTVPAGWTDGTAVTVTIPTSDIGDGSSFTDGDYTLTATASDTAGNSSQPSDSIGFTLDTTAPGEGTGPNGTDELPLVEVPEATGGVGEDELTDGVDVLVTPPTGTLPGDTITVTVTQPDGSTTDVTTTVPDGWTGGTPVPVVVSPEDLGGTGGELPDEGDYTITTTVTDGAGNTSSPSEETGFTVDTTAPGEGTGEGGADEIPLVAIPEAADGVNKDEASDGVDVLVTPPTGIKPGDTVTLTLTKPDGSTTDISTTVPAGWTDGTAVTVTIPTSDIGDGSSFTDGDYTLTATASDTAGNSSQPSDSIGFTLDTTAPGEGTGPNGTDELPLVEVPEATGGVGEDELTDGVDVLVTPPTGTLPGDTITVTVTQPDGSTTDVTTTVPDGWTGGTPVPVVVSPEDLGGTGGELPDEGDYTITTTVTDGAGNTSSPSEETGFTVDTTAPGEGTGEGGADEIPLVAIPEAADGVNKDEASDGVDVLVTPPTGIKPGDTVTLTLTKPDGSTTDISTTVPAGWTDGTAVTVTIPTSDIGDGSSFTDGDYTLTATASDTAGNSSQPSDSIGFTLDTTAPGEGTGPNGTDELPLVEVPEATGGVGEDELTDGVDVLVTPPTGTLPGDTITVTVTQPDGSTTDVTTTVPDGWTGGTPVPVVVSPEDLGGTGGELPDEGDYTITSTVTDSAGNTSTPSEETGFTVDITAPDSSSTHLTINTISADNIVNAQESKESINVTGTVTGEFNAGDQVTVSVNGNDFTGNVSPSGQFSIAVPGDQLVADPDSIINVQLEATDSAGNTGVINGTQSYSVDLAAQASITLDANIAEDGAINYAESQQNIDITGTVNGDVKPGDIVTVAVNNVEYTSTVNADNTFSVAVSGADLAASADKTVTANVTATDNAGNTVTVSDSETYTAFKAKVESVTHLRDGVEGSTSPGWTVNFDHAAIEDTTVRLNFNDGYHQANFGADYSGKVVIYNLAGQKVGEEVLSAANNWRVDISVPAGELGVRVYAETLNDDVYEGNETIQIQAAVPGRQEFVQSAEAVITDNADIPKVASITHLQDATEGGQWAGWTVNMTNASTTDSTVQLNFQDGLHQANFGADYSGTVHVYTKDGTLLQEVELNASNHYKADITIPAGHSGVNIYADTLNDDVYEGSETIVIQGAVPGRQEFVQSAEAVITDNADIPKVESITAFQNAIEGDQWAGWNVNMTNTSTTDSTVQLNFQDGLHQANFGADYSGTVHVYTKDGTLLQEVELNASNHYKADITIPAGHSGVNIYADTLNDDVYEGSETIVIQGAVPGRQEFVQSAEAVITDNADIPKVESITAFQNAIEGDQWAGWNVNMTNTSTTATTVRLKFDDALHQAGITNHGDDYNGQVNVHDLNGNFLQTVILNAANSYQADITIPAGHAGVQVSAATLQDNVYEGNETLVISGAVIDQQGWVQSNNALIIDNADIPKVESITAFQNAIEGDQWAGWNVNMTNTSTTATTVRLKFDDALHQAGITNHGDDYNGQVNVHDLNGNFLQTVILNAANSYQADITIPAGHAGVQVSAATLQDNVYEGNETLVISGAVIDQQGWVQSNNALIIDNADIPKVESITAFQNAIEGDQWAGWNVNMTNTSTTATTVRLKFDDALHQAGITNHGDDYNGQVNVHDLNGNFLQTVILNAANSYQADITIPAGHAGVQVSAATLQDNVYEGNETLVISGAVIDQQGWVQSNNALIIDNADIPKVESITAFQNAIEGDQWAGWNVNMTNTSTTATTVRLKFDDALHQAGITNHGDDYNGQVNVHDLNGNFLQTVILNAANSYQADITIPAGHAGVQVSAATLQDNVYEGNETLVISGAVIDQQGWVQSNNALIIDNADIPKVESITAFQNAIEGDQWAGWNVNMTNTSTTATTVRLKFDDALHQAGITNHGDDYNGQVNVHDLNGNFLQTVILNAANSYQADITIPAGHAGVQVSAATLQDNVYEGNETLVISGAVIDQQGWVQSNNALIIDNADIPKVESITAFQNAIEGDQWAGWNVNMTNTSTTATTVRLKFDDALHQAGITNHGDDYNGQVNVHDLNGNFLQTVILNAANSYQADITIPAGHAGVQVSAATLQDNVYEGNETLVISGAVIDQQGWVQSNNALIIDNADIPEVDSITWRENATEGNWVSWDLNMTNTSTTDTTIEVKFSDGAHQADFGSDYNGKIQVYTKGGTFLEEIDITGYKGAITVPAGQDGVIIYADTLNDDVYEGNESFTIMAGATHQDWVQSDTATITDEADLPEVDSVTRVQDAIEGGQWAAWTVNMTNTSTTDSIVELSFDDSLHQAGILNHGDDYVGQVNVHALDGTFLETVYMNIDNVYRTEITVPAGHEGVQLRAATMQDSVYEGNETLVIKAGAPHQAWVTSDAVVIIDDADIPKVASITHLQNADESGWVGWNLNMTNTSTTDSTVQLHFDDGLHQANFGADYNGKVHVYTTSGTFLKEVTLNSSNGWKANIEVPAGHSGVKVYAQTLNDNVYEGNETIKIQGAVIGQQGWVQSANAIITDEADKPSLSVVNTNTSGQVQESQWATFSVKLSSPVDQATKVQVNVWTASNPNITNKDVGNYEYWTGSSWANFKSGSSLTFGAFQTEIQIRVKPINDNKVESNETLYIKAQPISTEIHIKTGLIEGSVVVLDAGHTDTSNSKGGFVHWHIDGGGAQHITGNRWQPNEKVFLYGPDGSRKAVYADSDGFFHVQGTDYYTSAGTLSAIGAKSGSSKNQVSVTPNITPIVLDLDGDGIETSDVTETPVSFDYDGDGKAVETGWVSGGDGLLVRDINKDGQINDGSELFGSNTHLQDGTTASDGYEALAQHDSNADGVIDKNDAIYSELGVWVDKDQDGETDEGELLSMEDAGVASINLDAQSTDDTQNNNVIGKTSTYTTTDGEERVAADVWFSTQQSDNTEQIGFIEEHTISGLDQSELNWNSEDVSSQPWSDTVTDFIVGETTLNLSDLVTDSQDNLLTDDSIDIYEEDGSLILRVDTDGDQAWNQEIILQDISLNDIVDENGMIKNGVFADDSAKELFQKASSSLDVSENTHTHLEDPKIEDH